jgi:hypothetical protein
MKTIKTRIYIEAEVEVCGHYIPEVPEVRYLSNGDPGQPSEPERFDIVSVVWNGLDITKKLDDSEYDFNDLEDDCLTKINK